MKKLGFIFVINLLLGLAFSFGAITLPVQAASDIGIFVNEGERGRCELFACSKTNNTECKKECQDKIAAGVYPAGSACYDGASFYEFLDDGKAHCCQGKNNNPTGCKGVMDTNWFCGNRPLGDYQDGNTGALPGNKYYCYDRVDVADSNVSCIQAISTNCSQNGGKWTTSGRIINEKGEEVRQMEGSCGECTATATTDQEFYYCVNTSQERSDGICRGTIKYASLAQCEANHQKCFTKEQGCPGGKQEQVIPECSVYNDVTKPSTPKPSSTPSKSISIGDGGIADIIAGLGSIGDGLVPGCSPVTLGCVIALVVNKIVMPAAGLLLFLMIVWGGYKIVNGSFMGTQNSIDIGKRRILGAVLGFLLLSVVWWIWSLVEKVLGLSVVE